MAELTVYPEAGNGYCQCEQSGSSWANVQGETGETGVTTSVGSTINEAVGPARVNDTNYRLGRFFIPFDTSGLGVGAVVSAATLSVYIVGKDDDDNDGDDWINVVQTTQAATGSLATSDYELCGDSIDDPTEGATRIDIGDITTSAYNTWTLNATGRGWIDVEGDTKLGMREGHDCLDNKPAVDGGRNILDVRTVAYADTTSDPKLIITYSEDVEETAAYDAVPAVATVPAITASYVLEESATYTPVSALLTVPNTTATFEAEYSATYTALSLVLTIPDMTATGTGYWVNPTKNTADWANITKNTANYSNKSKNSSNWDYNNKN